MLFYTKLYSVDNIYNVYTVFLTVVFRSIQKYVFTELNTVWYKLMYTTRQTMTKAFRLILDQHLTTVWKDHYTEARGIRDLVRVYKIHYNSDIHVWLKCDRSVLGGNSK